MHRKGIKRPGMSAQLGENRTNERRRDLQVEGSQTTRKESKTRGREGIKEKGKGIK